MELKNIRFENFRGFIDTGKIDVKPLTVLVGGNASGKSTFLRFFPLLKQTLTTKTSEPILWYGDLVDFGDFETTLNNHSKDKGMYVTLSFDLHYTDLINYRVFRRLYDDKILYYNRFLEDKNKIKEKIDTEIRVKIDKKNFSEIHIDIYGHKIQVNQNSDGELTKLKINSFDFTDSNEFFVKKIDTTKYKLVSSYFDFLPSLVRLEDNNKEELIIYKNWDYEPLKRFIKSHSDARTSNETIENIISRAFIGTYEQIIENYKKKYVPQSFTKKITKTFSNNEKDILVAYTVFYNLNSIISSINEVFSNYKNAIKYITPLRADVERYYRIVGLQVDELDSSGKNTSMFLKNLSETELQDLRSFSKEKFNIEFYVKDCIGHNSIVVKTGNNRSEINITDTGFGFSQILPIIISLWKLKKMGNVGFGRNNSKSLFIEQPELHLHPEMQAKLVDVFCNIISDKKIYSKTNIMFETHSETMINRIGQLIRKKVISSKDVAILIFDQNDYENTVRNVSYNDEGYIEDWPLGFFAPERL